MSFQIGALGHEQFAPLFRLQNDELADHFAVRRTATTKPGFPCRVSLADAPEYLLSPWIDSRSWPVAGFGPEADVPCSESPFPLKCACPFRFLAVDVWLTRQT